MMSRFQRLLRTARHMFATYSPPKRPTFPVDELPSPREGARGVEKPPVGRKTPESDFLRGLAQRNLIIEDQPDYGERRPVDYDGLPNG